jgi:hypothetical protein
MLTLTRDRDIWFVFCQLSALRHLQSKDYRRRPLLIYDNPAKHGHKLIGDKEAESCLFSVESGQGVSLRTVTEQLTQIGDLMCVMTLSELRGRTTQAIDISELGQYYCSQRV